MLVLQQACRGALGNLGSLGTSTAAMASTSSSIIRLASSEASDEKKRISKKTLEDLTKASPTGRLLDLFGPNALGPSSSSSGPPPPPTKQQPSTGRQRDRVVEDASKSALRVMLQAMENCKPLIKVQSINTGAKIIHVPKPLTPNEQQSMSVRWIVEAAQTRQDTSNAVSMAECLAIELLLAYRKEGAARKKRDDVHTLALENKNNVGGYRMS